MYHESIWDYCIYMHHIKGTCTCKATLDHTASAYSGFCSMKRLGVLLLPLDGMQVHQRLAPSILLLVLIYAPGWREAVESSNPDHLMIRSPMC